MAKKQILFKLVMIGAAVTAAGGLTLIAFKSFNPSKASSKIQVSWPAGLPVPIVGETYEYSFCKQTPPLQGPNDLCGGVMETQNPTGGKGPYRFSLESGVGFPPFGLTLYPNGLLVGTPDIEGLRRIRVCVSDIGGSTSCYTYELTVQPAPQPKPETADGAPETATVKELEAPAGASQPPVTDKPAAAKPPDAASGGTIKSGTSAPAAPPSGGQIAPPSEGKISGTSTGGTTEGKAVSMLEIDKPTSQLMELLTRHSTEEIVADVVARDFTVNGSKKTVYCFKTGGKACETLCGQCLAEAWNFSTLNDCSVQLHLRVMKYDAAARLHYLQAASYALGDPNCTVSLPDIKDFSVTSQSDSSAKGSLVISATINDKTEGLVGKDVKVSFSIGSPRNMTPAELQDLQMLLIK